LNVPIVALLCSVQNDGRVHQIFAEHKPNTFYHAAAYKHVPIVEDNPLQGVDTNVIGTMVCAIAARQFSVEKFVLISTDKAVRPTNVMGASKRVAELIVQGIQNQCQKTKYAIVRFGNVLDSSGSVVPKFRQQINDGGPVTLTHKNVTRYFMTILEASQLVIQAGAITDALNDTKVVDWAPVFVLDMGQPVKIYDLIARMIKLAGLTICNSKNLDGDIEIKVIGLRPGEKLYEELLIDGHLQDTLHKKIKLLDEPFLSWKELKEEIEKLEDAVAKNEAQIMHKVFSKIVSGYDQNGLSG
jgi:FlaA1/EpsC-like NDP-sugar epimerase